MSQYFVTAVVVIFPNRFGVIDIIYISDSLISQIKRDAENAYPDECCGFIFGVLSENVKKAVSVRAEKNSFEQCEKYHRFNISADTMLKAERHARKNNLDIVGIYHSHPDCKAIPSEYDRIHALPVYSYIIVSVIKGTTADVTCHELGSETNYTQFIREQIVIDNKGDF